MINPLTPRMSLRAWTANTGLHAELKAFLESDAFCAAAEILLSKELPSQMAGASIETIALQHQFEAGFIAFFRGLQTLTTLDGSAYAQMMERQKLEAQGPWGGYVKKYADDMIDPPDPA